MKKEKNQRAYPELSKKQIGFLKGFGHLEQAGAGEVIIHNGEHGFDLFVVIKGRVDIVDPYKPEQVIVSHTEAEFTGDSDMLSKRAAVFTAIAGTDVELLRVPHSKLGSILSANAELNDLFVAAFIARRAELLKDFPGGLILIGSRFCPECYQMREFLSKNHIRYKWMDTEKDPVSAEILSALNVKAEETPIVVGHDQKVYRNPSVKFLAEELGLKAVEVDEKYDLLVVGAGPAGLAASVYAASEGLKVITIDSVGPGGQASASARIENYLGFPTGISGSDLAQNAYLQAQKFGCTISIPTSAKKLVRHSNIFELQLDDGTSVFAKVVVAATGAKYRSPEVNNFDFYKGRGVYYSATAMEARSCENEEVVIVGGGNSAGQAALFLAEKASRVNLIFRRESLTSTMSSYLIRRIENNPKIRMFPKMQLAALAGEEHLTDVRFSHVENKQKLELKSSYLFMFIGAEPCTNWIGNNVCIDKDGFVLTGNDLCEKDLASWDASRPPFPLETSLPGLFVVGDLRSGSIKRVASAVGEGSMVVSFVHRFFG